MLSCFVGACSVRVPPIIIEEDFRRFGTREYWLHRQNALLASLFELLEETGTDLQAAQSCANLRRIYIITPDTH